MVESSVAAEADRRAGTEKELNAERFEELISIAGFMNKHDISSIYGFYSLRLCKN